MRRSFESPELPKTASGNLSDMIVTPVSSEMEKAAFVVKVSFPKSLHKLREVFALIMPLDTALKSALHHMREKRESRWIIGSHGALLHV